MEIIIASRAGACYGVQRALNLAQQAAQSGGDVQTLGSLIHNPQVVAELAASGVEAVSKPEDLTASRVIIRSHGVTPQVREGIEQAGADIIDATCPHVLRAQQAARELALEGRLVIVVGEESHPEVEGLRAWAEQAGGQVVVAATPDDVPPQIDGSVGIVVQTTQRREKLDAIIDVLKSRGIKAEIRDTICSATSTRQEAAAELASQVDVMVVIGGHNSSNTTRLFEICRARSPQAFHIESPDELQSADFKGAQRVGVTAGASTPEDQIESVIERLRSFAESQEE
ncbi:4-hydroxy-3-methylbut-2-enyl diphosphate reductase [Cryptobacterium curtum]|uniref:4-hydroxy-3-methylbut-2-enyl diphosphate reductase n=1 Tax=Cryptobacterium curtum TaxID=84163 RepID=UPI00248F269A|nr:4-hydroxy-3-methylbut-2-enyl diphosphate reductase [Cryptobacterium curtum]